VLGWTQVEGLQDAKPEEDDRKPNAEHALIVTIDERRNAPCHVGLSRVT
jgi:hypothetical protein